METVARTSGARAAASTGNPDSAADAGASGLASLFDEWAYGVLIVTSEARLVHANQAAQQELARAEGLALCEGRIHSPHADQQKNLMCAVGKAKAGLRSLLTVDAGAGCELTFAVLPVRTEPPIPPRVALVFARATVCDALMLCFFARSHGLTATEEQVLGILCQGFSAPEVAARMKVAVSTVRSHVRSLCAKTQSSGVRSLVKRVSLLPPLGTWRVHDPLH